MRTVKFPTIFGLGLLVAGLTAVVILVGRNQKLASKAAPPQPLPERVVISNISDHSFVVSWVTSAPTMGYILIGKTGQSLDRRIADDRDKDTGSTLPIQSATHYFTIDNLDADSSYSFRLGVGESTSDQNKADYSVTTAPTLSDSSPPDTAQGVVYAAANTPAAGAIVYAQLPAAQLMSALVSKSGNWVIPLSTTRRADLSGWIQYDRTATIYSLHVDGGDRQADATLTSAVDRPTAPIYLGQVYDFRKSREPLALPTAAVTIPVGIDQNSSSKTPVSLFNFGDLGAVPSSTAGVTLDNPGSDNEIIYTDKPEFFGKGPSGTEVELVIESTETITASAVVSEAGRWSFSLPKNLSPGRHKITIRWVDPGVGSKTISRNFVVSADSGPAFTATDSAAPTTGPSPRATATPTVKVSPTPRPTVAPRTSYPPPDETPQSGNLTPGIILFMMGVIFFAAGLVVGRRNGLYGR